MRALFKAIVILALALLPMQAHAGLLEFAITVAAIVALGPAGIGVITWASVGINVGLAAYGQYQADQQRRQLEDQQRAARDSYNASLTDRTITSVSTEAPFVRVYGRARVGSAVVAILPSGARDEYQHIIAIHAAHECDGFEEIYIAKKPLGALDANGFAMASPDYSTAHDTFQENIGTTWTIHADYVPGSVVVKLVTEVDNESVISVYETPVAFSQVGNAITVSPSAKYRTYFKYKTSSVRVKKHLGVPGEAADATLIAEVGSKWTLASKLSGFCYTYIRLDLNQREFQGGLPAIEVLLRGAKIYDPRNATTVWSQNPALALYDYLRCDFCAVPSTEIPAADVITAANVCDEVISIGARYTFNGTVTSEQSQPTVITQMAQAMAGGIDSTTWSMWAGKYVAPTLTLQQADIVGSLAITPGLSDADICNGVTARFISAENDYAATDMQPYQNAVYLASDGRQLFHGMEFPFTNETQRCHNLARIYVEDQRNGFTVKGVFSLKAWDTRIGQRVALTSSFFGWAAKVFRIVGKTYTYNGTVELLLKEDAAEIWDLADAVVVDATPNTSLPNPYQIAAPVVPNPPASGTAQLLKQADGTVLSRVLFTWTASASVYAAQAEIQLKPYLSGNWETVALVDAQAGQHYITDVRDGITYDFRIRFVNPYLAVQSPWTNGVPHTVVGKTAPPADVGAGAAVAQGALLEVYWPDNSDVDIGVYEVRATDSGWGTPGYLYRGRASECTLAAPAPGTTGVAYLKAADTSKNYSVNATLITHTSAAVPNPTGLAHSFAGSSTTGATFTLDFNDAAPEFGLSHYKISYAGTVKTVKASTITVPANWLGNQDFMVQTVDRNGHESSGVTYSVTKLAPNPPVNFGGFAVHNTASFGWQAPAITTLPISHYLLKKGATYATAVLLGRVDNTFSDYSDLAAGTDIYWLVSVDNDRRESAPVSYQLTVFLPRDYQLVANWTSDFSGTLVNALVEAGALVLPVNTTETIDQHFTNNGWASPQDQINAGFPIFIQPGAVSGSYKEVRDYGTTLASMGVRVLVQLETVVGIVAYTVTIRVAQDAGFTVGVQTFTGLVALASNFRYVEVTVTVTATNNQGIGRIPERGLIIKLDARVLTERGRVSMSLGGAHAQGNIAPETLDLWVPAMSMPPAGFTLNGTTNENKIVSGIGPSGAYEPLWACVDYDVASDADGGWDSVYFPAALSTVGQLVACFMKQSTAAGTSYLGTSTDGSILDLAGTVNNNPYFFNGDLPALNTWYLVIGYVHPIGYGATDTNIAGVYNLAGTRLVAGTEFKGNTGAAALMHRAYHYYNATGGGTEVQWMTRPVVLPCAEADAAAKITYLLKCAKEFGAAVRMPADVIDVINPWAQALGLDAGEAKVDFFDKPNPDFMNTFILQAGALVAGEAGYGYDRY